MSQPDTPELADGGDDHVMSLLLNKDEDKPEGEAPPEQEETDAPEADETPEDDDAPETEVEDDPEFEIDAGGKKEKVKLSDLRAGYMKDADYRRKTAEVAEQRRTAEQLSQHFQQKLQTAANQLDVHLASLHSTLIGSQPKPELIDSDPQEFLRQQAEYQQRVAQYQAAMQHRQAIGSEQEAERQRLQREYAQGESQRLLEALPAWREEKTRNAETKQVAEYLSSIGYTPDELNQLVDHRALLVARDAAKYRAQQAAKAKQAPPAVGKTVKPGAARSDTSTKSAYQEALAKARKTGRPEDIQRALAMKGT